MFAWCTPSDVLYLLNLCLKEKSENKIDINKNDLFHAVSACPVTVGVKPVCTFVALDDIHLTEPSAND